MGGLAGVAFGLLSAARALAPAAFGSTAGPGLARALLGLDLAVLFATALAAAFVYAIDKRLSASAPDASAVASAAGYIALVFGALPWALDAGSAGALVVGEGGALLTGTALAPLARGLATLALLGASAWALLASVVAGAPGAAMPRPLARFAVVTAVVALVGAAFAAVAPVGHYSVAVARCVVALWVTAVGAVVATGGEAPTG